MKHLAALAVTTALLLPSGLLAQERVAQLTKVDGAVQIERLDGASVDEARQVGPRVRNGSVYGGDVVRTGAGGAATLVFTDGSEVRLSADSAITVQEIDVSVLVASGQKDKPIGRTIKVLAGDIWSDIAQNAEISTKFETPTGVSAVKGTVVETSVDPSTGRETVQCSEGDCAVSTPGTGLEIDLQDGYGVGLGPVEQAETPPRATTPTRGAELTATERDELVRDANEDGKVSPGDRIRVMIDVENSGATTAKKVKLFHRPSSVLRIVEGSASTTHGEIDSLSPLAASLGPLGPKSKAIVSFEAVVLDRGAGSLSIEAFATNTGPMHIRTANGRTVSANPGARLAAMRDGFSVSLAIEAGNALFGDDPLMLGEQVRYAYAAFAPSSSMSLETVEGSVELSDPDRGLKMDVTSGFEVTLSQDAAGDLRIQTPADNPGQILVQHARGEATVDPGSKVAVRTQRVDLEVQVNEGAAEVTKTSDESDEDAPPDEESDDDEEDEESDEGEDEESESTDQDGDDEDFDDEFDEDEEGTEKEEGETEEQQPPPPPKSTNASFSDDFGSDDGILDNEEEEPCTIACGTECGELNVETCTCIEIPSRCDAIAADSLCYSSYSCSQGDCVPGALDLSPPSCCGDGTCN